jgi:hypothetical protein
MVCFGVALPDIRRHLKACCVLEGIVYCFVGLELALDLPKSVREGV